MVQSVPALNKLARRTRDAVRRLPGVEPLDGFYSAAPDNLVALVRAFNLQQAERAVGRDLFDRHAYYEFGMFRGFSFWFAEQISREYAPTSFRLYGFDSFEGLPRPQLAAEARIFVEGDFRGTYATVTAHLTRWRTDFSRIRLHRGFYAPELFRELVRTETFAPVSICLIDVDLYESCVPVLDFLRDRLVPGSILLFDDYNQMGDDDGAGERRALIEFEGRHPTFRKQHLFDYGWEGVAFRVEAV
jgi:hypothetical protein